MILPDKKKVITVILGGHGDDKYEEDDHKDLLKHEIAEKMVKAASSGDVNLMHEALEDLCEAIQAYDEEQDKELAE